MNNKEIADRVRELREQRKLTQEEVADVLGIRQPAYSDMENGHTAFKAVDLDKLAEFYGKSLDELLRGDKAVMHMHDHSTHGFNAYHMQHQHGVSEETMKKFLEALVANTNALERLAEKQGQMFELLAKR
jgi:transcriptional regulator with XRE-family HTH domain